MFQDPENPKSVVHTVRNIVEGRMRLEGLASLSPHCAHLIRWLLANNAAERPTLEQISQHPWLTEMAKQQVKGLLFSGL
jgi:serine/threonine protein kinase